MSMVSAKARLRPRRSPLRMRQRPHWMTPELETRIRVAMITRGLMANSTPSGRAGQWLPDFAPREETAEEHDLAGDEQQHAQQRGVDTAVAMTVRQLHGVVGGEHVGRRGHRCDPSPDGSAGAWPAPPCLRSKRGRSERISGRRSKLYEGGGLVVAHSRVFASQGSSPAVRGPRSATNMFQSRTRVPKPMR